MKICFCLSDPPPILDRFPSQTFLAETLTLKVDLNCWLVGYLVSWFGGQHDLTHEARMTNNVQNFHVRLKVLRILVNYLL